MYGVPGITGIRAEVYRKEMRHRRILMVVIGFKVALGQSSANIVIHFVTVHEISGSHLDL